jgi:hypothetical protein
VQNADGKTDVCASDGCALDDLAEALPPASLLLRRSVLVAASGRLFLVIRMLSSLGTVFLDALFGHLHRLQHRRSLVLARYNGSARGTVAPLGSEEV